MQMNGSPDARKEPTLPVDDRGNLYHVFVSYKSQDSDLVRVVTDWLTSVGKRIWFAEYQVLLHEREQFQQAIDHGVARSQWGLLFTNRAYVDSEHCRNELQGLAADSGCGPERILEVVLGDAPLAIELIPASLRGRVPAPHRFSDLPALLRWLSGRLGIDEAQAPSPTTSSGEDVYRGMADAYSMDLSGWETTSSETGWRPDRVFDGPAFRSRTNAALSGKLTIASVRGADRKSMQYGTDVSFQRNYFNALIGFARNEFQDDAKRCVGVHLVHKDGRVHFATTSCVDGEWRRDYYLESPDAYANGLEFALTFRSRGSFQEFCRGLPAAEAVAQSMRFDSRLRYVTLIDVQARETVAKHGFQLSWSPPIGWKRTGTTVTDERCDVDFRPARQGFFERLFGRFAGRREPTFRQKMLKDVYSPKDLLNLQVRPCDAGFSLEMLEARVRRTIAAHGGTLTFHMNGNRHGVRTYECLYQWVWRGRRDYGFQVNFILGGRIFSVQINSPYEIAKGDERLLVASAFADCIRVAAVDGAFEPERKRESETTGDGESAAAAHYRAVRMTVAPPKCHLTLAAAEPDGANVYLAYRWSEDLTHDEADRVDTCVRAFINSRIGDIAQENGVAVRLRWGVESLIGAPIPLWHLDRRDQATYVVNSKFDVDQKVVTLTVGPRFARRPDEYASYDPTSVGLCRGFMSRLSEIEIKPVGDGSSDVEAADGGR